MKSLQAALAERVDGEVRFDAGTRAVVTRRTRRTTGRCRSGVVVPRNAGAAAEAVACVPRTRSPCAVAGRRDQPGWPVLQRGPWSSTGLSTATR